jgi:hypothetical protein
MRREPIIRLSGEETPVQVTALDWVRDTAFTRVLYILLEIVVALTLHAVACLVARVVLLACQPDVGPGELFAENHVARSAPFPFVFEWGWASVRSTVRTRVQIDNRVLARLGLGLSGVDHN